jgi:3-oxoacyl-[acyl-carrier-protein] synthase-1
LLPGEAAAFLVLEPLGSSQRERALVQLTSWADSAAPSGDKTPLPGSILARAASECLRRAAIGGTSPSLILSDMNGAKHEALELAFARIRAFPDQASSALLLHPAESLGDVGAATGPLLMVLATLCHLHGGAPPGDVLLATSAPTGHSAVSLIQPTRS